MFWNPVRVVVESEPIHQTSRMLAHGPFGFGRPHAKFGKLVRRELLGAEDLRLTLQTKAGIMQIFIYSMLTTIL